MTDPTVIAQTISKSYVNRAGVTVPALRRADVIVHPGQLTAVVGRSGSGKSTLLHCLSGLDRPDEGSIELLGLQLARAKESAISDLYCRDVGFVFQQYNLVESLTARENVVLPQRLLGKRMRQEDVVDWFEIWGLAGKEDNYPSQLSGGEQQRVALVRALAKKPKVLFADEPTGALDSTNGKLVLNALKGWARDGVSVLMVTHDIGAASIADRVFVLRDGRITHDLSRTDQQTILDAMDADLFGDASE